MRSVTHLGLAAVLTLSVAAYAQTPSTTAPADSRSHHPIRPAGHSPANSRPTQPSADHQPDPATPPRPRPRHHPSTAQVPADVPADKAHPG